MNRLYERVVITGGGGMLAHALADELRGRGVEPTVLPRSACDIAKASDIERIFDQKPTLLLNCAAHTKVDLCEEQVDLANRVNGTAVGEMAALCKRHGTALVHVSTDFVFDGAKGTPYAPTDPVNPLGVYGSSKLLGETELQKHAPADWLIVRTAWVYGRNGASFPRTMVQAARANKPLKVVADQQGTPTYTVDLAQAILTLLDLKQRGIWHITNDGPTNWHEFAIATLREFGLPNDVGAITSADWQKIKPNSAPRPNYSVPDISAYGKLTGKPMRHWRDALHDFRLAVDAAGGFD